jgi:subtilisin
MSIAASLKATGIAEVIVFVRPDAGGAAAALGDGAASAVLKHFSASPFSQDAALLEALRGDGPTAPASLAARNAAVARLDAGGDEPAARYFPNLGLALGTVNRHSLASLRAEPAVVDIVPAPQLRLIRPVLEAAATAAPGYPWGLRSLEIDQLHGEGLSGKGVLIGHLDTGVDATHPALEGAVRTYAEFDSLGVQIPSAVARDSAEHGTHTAGTLAGRESKGVRFGVAPGAELASAMVIEGGNVLARILGGMDWMVGLNVRVLSMSLGLIGVQETFLRITQTLRAKGVLPVFAVGNDEAGTSRYPGNYAEALSVGAADSAGRVADFSSSQRFKRKVDSIVPDLVGPGVDVISCVPGGKYKRMSGTSMATPHIAGLVALLMEAKPDKSIDEIEKAIFASCQLLPDMLVSRANRGYPNALRALKSL